MKPKLERLMGIEYPHDDFKENIPSVEEMY